MTNADCIRRMSDEQLDEFLAQWECGDIDYAVTFCDWCIEDGNVFNFDCDGCRKNWLKRDATAYDGLLYDKRVKQTEPKYDALEVAKDINRRVDIGQRLETMSCQECKYWKYIAKEWQCSVVKCQYEPKGE